MPRVIERADFERVFEAISRRGYQILGPTLRGGTLVYDRIESVAELPADWSDEQGAGTYRLKQDVPGLLFGYTLGQESWKNFFFLLYTAFGVPNDKVVGLWSMRRLPRFNGLPLSVCAHASCGQSRFRIVFSREGRMSSQATVPDVRGSSCSQ
jgi:hypothetical protein